MLNADIPLPDVLRIATWNGVQFIAYSLNMQQRFGAVAEGHQGDLLLLESNPLDSVENLRQLTGVMVGGEWRSQGFFTDALETIAASYGQ